ncbi:ribbon-helix-helix domain-containing protein [Desulfurobacterium sp.]
MEKVVFSTRLPKALTEALESAKWELKMPKGKIVEEAIKEYLRQHCPDIYEEYLKDEKRE